MDRITGNGRPTKHTKGEVGQWYEDLETGDIWECRIAHEYSAIHGYPVGGYVWELRATGEDIREIYGGVSSWNDLAGKPFYEVDTKTLVDTTVQLTPVSSFAMSETYYWISNTITLSEALTPGNTYEVKFNNLFLGESDPGMVPVVCQDYSEDGDTCLEIYNKNDDIIALVKDGDGYAMHITHTTTSSHEDPFYGEEGSEEPICISVPASVVRLDEKFMPLLTDSNGVKYKLTVGTDGTLSATKV